MRTKSPTLVANVTGVPIQWPAEQASGTRHMIKIDNTNDNARPELGLLLFGILGGSLEIKNVKLRMLQPGEWEPDGTSTMSISGLELNPTKLLHFHCACDFVVRVSLSNTPLVHDFSTKIGLGALFKTTYRFADTVGRAELWTNACAATLTNVRIGSAGGAVAGELGGSLVDFSLWVLSGGKIDTNYGCQMRNKDLLWFEGNAVSDFRLGGDLEGYSGAEGVPIFQQLSTTGGRDISAGMRNDAASSKFYAPGPLELVVPGYSLLTVKPYVEGPNDAHVKLQNKFKVSQRGFWSMTYHGLTTRAPDLVWVTS